jgi:Tfp pilus assembly protein PilN
LLQCEAEQFRAQTSLGDEAPLDIFCVGSLGNANQDWDQRLHVQRLLQPADFNLRVHQVVIEGRQIEEHFPALAAALCGVRRTPPIPVDLLPAERQKRHPQWLLAPTYALVAVNLLLVAILVLRGPLQQKTYSGQLEREVTRLEPEVKKMRKVEEQMKALQRRIDFLGNFRRSDTRILGALNELSTILPKQSWVADFSLKNDVVEITGISDSATALPQLLENSPFFKHVEFVSPIAPDSTGKEVYRIRMQLE